MKVFMSTENNCTIVSMILAMFIVAGIFLPLSGIVINDWAKSRKFTEHHCSGEELHDLDISSGGLYARGTVQTCTTISSTNKTCVTPVELYYPPVNWLLAGRKTEDVKSWAAGLGSAQTFTCLLDGESRKGISSVYDKIAGWFVMLIIGALCAIILLAIPVYLFIVYGCSHSGSASW
jgi:hypothetical protein